MWLADYSTRTPTANPPGGMDMADAACTRGKFQRGLAQTAGLTDPAVQAKFNTDAPVWGALFRDGLLDNELDGASVSAINAVLYTSIIGLDRLTSS